MCKVVKASPRVQKTRKPDKKKFPCGECNYWAASQWKLAGHMRTHTGLRPFPCDIGDCKKRFALKGNLTKHQLRHQGYKPHSCSQCDYKSFAKKELTRHERTHSGEKPFACHICGFKCNAKANFEVHKKTHGEKKHVCGFGGWCEFRTHYSDSLKSHKKTHTIEGQIRKKKQENRVNELLKEWGYTVDAELTISAKNSGCLTDTDRYYSRIDFVVINCTSAILILECDEEAHASYTLSCEFSRMADVQASLTKAGFTAPVYWLRYAPTGKYHIGGEQVKMHRPKREAALKKHLAKLCSPDFRPEHQVNVNYMFYDLESAASGPSIMLDSDFPAVMKPFVSWTCP